MTVLTNQAETWELCIRDVEVLVSPDPRSAAPDESAEATSRENLAWTLPRFRERFGNVWVSGRGSIDRATVRILPREDADAMSQPPLVIRLDELGTITTESKIFSKVVVLESVSGHTIRLRCRAPEAFAENLRLAAGQLRAAAA